jgi:hypothetical protein
VRARRQQLEHPQAILLVARLTEDLVVQHYRRVGTEHGRSSASCARAIRASMRSRLSLPSSKALPQRFSLEHS